MTLRAALLALWEAPQNLLGAALYAAERAVGFAEGADRENGRLFIKSQVSAVSLGYFVFWTEGTTRYFVHDASTRLHEYGHTFQSRLLGPLYLPLVGVPSVLRVLYALLYREATGRRWGGYFDGYPERWADRLGGVTRNYRDTLATVSDT
ncbi:MAG TPA: hypothetical protein PKA88_21440 [Polyangiaceae bacterium]|nr:hypothetical protein [Polyangiaceae bacterium]